MIVRIRAFLAAMLVLAAASGCTPDRAMDFGPVGEISSPPQDELSIRIIKEFNGRDFLLGRNDRQAEVRLDEWPAGYHLLIPFWLGVNPLVPAFMRPDLGRIYVISEATLVRPLGRDEYLIRAGSKMFKSDTVFEATHTRYMHPGKMLPTVVRFVGTRIVTLALDPPSTGKITEKVPILREISLPMRANRASADYGPFEVLGRGAARKGT
ncbi:MAG: hypothetical protein ABSD31_15275 [Candidatus Binataceae bacterium]|jgi:hypothetical protein